MKKHAYPWNKQSRKQTISSIWKDEARKITEWRYFEWNQSDQMWPNSPSDYD